MKVQLNQSMISPLRAALKRLWSTSRLLFSDIPEGGKKQEEELDFQGNTIGVCQSHRGIYYNKLSYATRRLRCGLPTTYYVSYRREEFQMQTLS